MEKQNQGFKFYSGKAHTPFSYVNFINQIPQQTNFFNNSIDKPEENSGNQKTSTKGKLISKGKQKEDTKKYDRGGNCVASNTSKLFIKILNKRLSRFPVIQNYLNYYEIYSQKENILLIPLCLYSFLKQYEHNYHKRFHLNHQVAHPQTYSSDEKINTRSIYTDIINQLKDHIECSLQNSRAKYKDCSDNKKQFHLKNISIYNKISQIIRKVEHLSLGLEQCRQHKHPIEEHEKHNEFTEVAQRGRNSSKQLGSDIKIQEEELHYNQFHQKMAQKVELSSHHSFCPVQSYDLSTFQSPLESLYQRKQRQYQKAMDKVYSIIMNQRPLRQMFQIYKINVKQILIQSVNYCYRRNINSRVKKNEKIIKDVYEKLQTGVVQNLKSITQTGLCLKGWEFVIAFLTLQVAGDKKEEIYEQFKENIRRKTKYFDRVQSAVSNDEREAFDKYYYSYSLRLLEQRFQSHPKGNYDFQKQKSRELHQKLKEWLIGYCYHSTLNKILTQQPKLGPRTSSEKIKQNLISFNRYSAGHDHSHQVSLHTMNPPRDNDLLVKQQEQVDKQIAENYSRQNRLQKQAPCFGYKEERVLEDLISQFEQFSKQNYESIY